jgi:hypothetical protein
MLEDLRSIAPPDRVGSIERQLDLLDASVSVAFDDPRDRAVALVPDPRGFGPAAADG